MEENKIIQEKRPNLFLAILCAVGLGLVGAVLWGLLITLVILLGLLHILQFY